MDTEQIIEQLKAERNRIDEAITVLGGSGTVGRVSRRPGPRHMSSEARRRISEAQKRRWARQRGGKRPVLVASSTAKPKGKSGMSAAGRKRLSQMMKKRWAERRKKAA